MQDCNLIAAASLTLRVDIATVLRLHRTLNFWTATSLVFKCDSNTACRRGQHCAALNQEDNGY